MSKIRITDLHLRTIIGANDWEREVKQDLIINIEFDCDLSRAIESDNLKDTVDYKVITKKIIKEVEASSYHLIEKLTQKVLDIVMSDSKVTSATVRIDKPGALRFSKSVSCELSQSRNP